MFGFKHFKLKRGEQQARVVAAVVVVAAAAAAVVVAAQMRGSVESSAVVAFVETFIYDTMISSHVCEWHHFVKLLGEMRHCILGSCYIGGWWFMYRKQPSASCYPSIIIICFLP